MMPRKFYKTGFCCDFCFSRCGRGFAPEGFAKVSYFYDWIEKTIKSSVPKKHGIFDAIWPFSRDWRLRNTHKLSNLYFENWINFIGKPQKLSLQMCRRLRKTPTWSKKSGQICQICCGHLVVTHANVLNTKVITKRPLYVGRPPEISTNSIFFKFLWIFYSWIFLNFDPNTESAIEFWPLWIRATLVQFFVNSNELTLFFPTNVWKHTN